MLDRSTRQSQHTHFKGLVVSVVVESLDKFRPVTFVVSQKLKKAGPASRQTRPCFSWLSVDYWIAAPPEGDAVSLPLAPIELVDCQIVPVVLVKK
jgi:hypothetical protein